MNPHYETQSDLLSGLQTSLESGLSNEQASQRLAKYGPNKLNEKKKKTNLQRFLDQFKDVMIIILLIAAVVSFVIACIEGDPMEFFEPVLILLIVVLNAIMGMVQESKAEKAIEALQEMKKDRIPAYKTEYGLLPYSEARKKKYTSKQLEQLEYVPSALPRYPMLQSFDFTQDSMDILLRYEELFQKQSQCKREWREQR